MPSTHGFIVLFYISIFYMFINLLSLGTLLVSKKHIIDILSCSVLNKLLGIYLFYDPFSENLFIALFVQWLVSFCFPG